MSSSQAPERVRETLSVARNVNGGSLNSFSKTEVFASKEAYGQKSAAKKGVIRHATSANLARALRRNHNKDGAREVDSSSIMLKRARKVSIQLLSPQLSLKSKAMLDLATLCWTGGKPVQDLVRSEGGLAEIMRVLSARAQGFVDSEGDKGIRKSQGVKPRRRRLSLESLTGSVQQLKRSIKTPEVDASVAISALGLLETLCSGHEVNQKELIELGFLSVYEKLMRNSMSVAEKVWATHCTLLLVLSNPQAQSRLSFAYSTGLQPRLKAISHKACWHTWHYNAAEQLITLQDKFTKGM